MKNISLVEPLFPTGAEEGGERASDEDGGGDDEGAGADPTAEGGAREEPDAVLPRVRGTQTSAQHPTLITHLHTIQSSPGVRETQNSVQHSSHTTTQYSPPRGEGNSKLCTTPITHLHTMQSSRG